MNLMYKVGAFLLLFNVKLAIALDRQPVYIERYVPGDSESALKDALANFAVRGFSDILENLPVENKPFRNAISDLLIARDEDPESVVHDFSAILKRLPKTFKIFKDSALVADENKLKEGFPDLPEKIIKGALLWRKNYAKDKSIVIFRDKKRIIHYAEKYANVRNKNRDWERKKRKRTNNSGDFVSESFYYPNLIQDGSEEEAARLASEWFSAYMSVNL